MASGSVWGVDIGKSSLKAVRMRPGKDELEVQALFFEEFQAADDGSIPPSEASRALEALLARYPQLKKEPALVALPGHTSFSRFIKLPPFDPRKLGEMVRFEAQQQIPFPIADVNWDFSLVNREYEADEDREIGLFAIKKEIVYTYIADLQLSGVEPAAITTTPLAIYNFVRYDLELPEDQATLVLDIGWNHTDLVIVDGERYWIRNLPLNGQELTKAIATKLKIGFAEAEQKKREAAQDKDARRLYQATELVLKDFVAEIQRSIAFYKAQNKDRQIQIGQVLLLGNGAKLPNIRPFFQKELGFPVETVKRLARLTLDVDIEGDEVELLKEHLPTFAVAFGLGVQGCGEGFNSVNLVPEEIRQKQSLEKKKPLVAAAVALIWATVLAAYFLSGRQLDDIKSVGGEANKNLGWLNQNDGQIKLAREPIEGLEKQLGALAAVAAKRNLALEVMNKLAPVLPKGNAEVFPISPAIDKELKTQGKNPAKMASVLRQLADGQDKINEEKTWIIDLSVKQLEDGRVRATVLCARKYKKNAQNLDDEVKTKEAVETGLFADLRRAFPAPNKVEFEGAPKKIWNLDKDATGLPPGGGPGGFGGGPAPGGAMQAFCGLTIAIEFGAPLAAAPAATAGAPPAPSGEN